MWVSNVDRSPMRQLFEGGHQTPRKKVLRDGSREHGGEVGERRVNPLNIVRPMLGGFSNDSHKIRKER